MGSAKSLSNQDELHCPTIELASGIEACSGHPLDSSQTAGLGARHEQFE